MWLHHDLAWWGVFFGVLALVLMLPVSIVANLVTPMLKNWWAERSVASTRERIEKLKKELAEYEQYPELSELEDWALKALEGVGNLGNLCVQLLAVGILIGVDVFDHVVRYNPAIALPAGIESWVIVLALVSIFLGNLTRFVILKKLAKLRKKQSPVDRAILGASIKKLEEKLARMS